MHMKEGSALNNADFTIFHTVSPTFRTFDFHAHDYFEIFCFLAGHVQYHIEDRIYSLAPGDLLVIPPSIMHRAVIIDENATYERIVLTLSGSFCSQLVQGLRHPFLNPQPQPVRVHLNDEELADYRKDTDKLLQLPDNVSGRLARDSICTLLLLQFQTYFQEISFPEDSPVQQIQEIIRYINSHYTQELSLEDIAAHFYISKSHLLRLFKRHTNATVHNYICAKRILLAKSLLKDGVPVGQVCNQCGFRSYPCFYQAFVRSTGTSPMQFIKTNRE